MIIIRTMKISKTIQIVIMNPKDTTTRRNTRNTQMTALVTLKGTTDWMTMITKITMRIVINKTKTVKTGNGRAIREIQGISRTNNRRTLNMYWNSK